MSRTSEARRTLIKSLVAGGGIALAHKSLPDKWHKPLVDSIVLPVHAQMSPMEPGFTIVCEMSDLLNNNNPIANGAAVAEGTLIQIDTTIDPNPGPGQPVGIVTRCVTTDTTTVDTDFPTGTGGQIPPIFVTVGGLCGGPGTTEAVEFTFQGAAAECSWDVVADP